MTKKHSIPGLAGFRKLTSPSSSRSRGHRPKAAAFARVPARLWRRFRVAMQNRRLRRWLIGTGAVAATVFLICGGLWWRLGSGPIAFDVATPWLTSAIEDNF